MKRLFLGLLFCLSGLTSFGQDGNFAVGFVGSLDFYDLNFKTDLQQQNSYETPFNYSLGLQASYAFSDNFSGNLAVLGARKGYEVTYNYNGQTTLPSNPRLTFVKPYYLEVPVSMDYIYFNNPHLKLFVSAGLVAALLVDDRQETTLMDNTEVENDYVPTDYSDFFMGATFSTGLKYMVNDTKSIRIEPYFRPYFSKVDKTLMESNTSLYGVTIGIFQHF